MTRYLVGALVGALTIFTWVTTASAEVTRGEFIECLKPYMVKGSDYDYGAGEYDDFKMVFPANLSGHCKGVALEASNSKNHSHPFQRVLAVKTTEAIRQGQLPGIQDASARSSSGIAIGHNPGSKTFFYKKQGLQWVWVGPDGSVKPTYMWASFDTDKMTLRACAEFGKPELPLMECHNRIGYEMPVKTGVPTG